MEKHELELVTSTCTMYCNVLLHDCTRHSRLSPFAAKRATMHVAVLREPIGRAQRHKMDATSNRSCFKGKPGWLPPRTIYGACHALSPRVAIGGMAD